MAIKRLVQCSKIPKKWCCKAAGHQCCETTVARVNGSLVAAMSCKLLFLAVAVVFYGIVVGRALVVAFRRVFRLVLGG